MYIEKQNQLNYTRIHLLTECILKTTIRYSISTCWLVYIESHNLFDCTLFLIEYILLLEHLFLWIKDKRNWCGLRNDFDSDEVIRNVTRCCEVHDACPDFILPRYMEHGLRNTGHFTRYHRTYMLYTIFLWN